MSAPDAFTSRQCTPFIAPWVPTGMKAGVRTAPWGVAITPLRARPSVAAMRNEKAVAAAAVVASFMPGE